MSVQHPVFITGGTGYIGQRLIPLLAARGHRVRALVRRESATRLPAGCEPVIGNALDASSFSSSVAPGETFVQMVGVPHPSPAKAQQFLDIDLASARAAAKAAAGRASHIVYVSVAQPSPVMRAYAAARAEGEAFMRATGLPATFVRPFYVLGPGHRWPYLLVPGYWICERLPSTRDTARRLGLVTLAQMLAALVNAIESPPSGVRIVDVPAIRSSRVTPLQPLSSDDD